MNHGRAVYSFAAGSKRLYDFINNNPTCCCAPVEWVNNCTNIAEINKFVSINSCIAVDIYGRSARRPPVINRSAVPAVSSTS